MRPVTMRTVTMRTVTMRTVTMRHVMTCGLVVFFLAIAGSGEARAQWCAYYDAYTYTCGFATFRQCLDTISGIGGECRRDPDPRRVRDHERERESGKRGRDRR